MKKIELTKENNKEKIGRINLFKFDEFSKSGIFVECEDGKPSRIILK